MDSTENIIFVGRFFSRRVLEKVMADPKYTVGLSNHNFEMSLIEGLKGICAKRKYSFKLISVPAVFSYPEYNSHIFTGGERYDVEGCDVRSIPMLNLFGINKIWIFFTLLFTLIRTYISCKGKKVNVIVDTPNWINDSALFFSKVFTRKKVETTLIVPDIPEVMNTMFTAKKSFKQKIVSVLNEYGRKMAFKYDGYVFLTEQMKTFFRPDAPYIVMEGLANEKWFEEKTDTSSDSTGRAILYTGTLARVFGIKILLDAFDMLGHKDVELWICGSGDMENEIEKMSQRNPNVKFKGMVSAVQARELQRQATILVNPRTSEGEFTKFSFPSKTMEYLSAGKPVVMNRLPGIPPEYYNYLHIPDDETPVAFARILDSLLDKPQEELNITGEAGRRFIMENKNSGKQAERIIELALNQK